jgi:hypothetical protein
MFGERVQIPHILYSLSYPLEHYYLNNSEVTTNHLNIVAESWLVSYSRKVLLSAKKFKFCANSVLSAVNVDDFIINCNFSGTFGVNGL